MTYDPSTDPHWISEEEAPAEDLAGKLGAELTILAQQRETFASPGWQAIEDQLVEQMQSAAGDLITFRPNRTPSDFAFVQGQIAKVQALLAWPERVRQEFDSKSLELAELQNPALA